jgi:pantetheine-phosphate adenylyltransferase
MKIAIYPGTFDPITYGHIDVIERAAEIFDTVIVAVARNSSKQPLFTMEERATLITAVVEYARKKKATSIVRGLRAVSDFEYEFQMALTNRKLVGKISTVFLMPHEKYTYLNSTIVREIGLYGGDISEFVPAIVRKALRKKVSELPVRK